MPLALTYSDVRHRARPLTAVELSDELLSSPAYIPAAVAETERLLATAGLDYDSMPAALQVLARTLAITICCRTIAASMPTRGLRAGAIEFEPMSATDKATVAERLDEEISRLCARLGVAQSTVEIGSAGGRDYEAIDAER